MLPSPPVSQQGWQWNECPASACVQSQRSLCEQTHGKLSNGMRVL